MSCDCRGCQIARRISTVRQLQAEKPTRAHTKKYPKRSKKIWDDRIRSQEKQVEFWQKRHDDIVENIKKEKAGQPWRGWTGEPEWYQKIADDHREILERIKSEARKSLGE